MTIPPRLAFTLLFAAMIAGCNGVIHRDYGYSSGKATLGDGRTLQLQIDGSSSVTDSGGVVIDSRGNPYRIRVYMQGFRSRTYDPLHLHLINSRTGRAMNVTLPPPYMTPDSTTLISTTSADIPYDDYVAVFRDRSGDTASVPLTIRMTRRYREEYISGWKRLGRL